MLLRSLLSTFRFSFKDGSCRCGSTRNVAYSAGLRLANIGAEITLFVEFIGTRGDLRRQIGRRLGCGGINPSFRRINLGFGGIFGERGQNQTKALPGLSGHQFGQAKGASDEGIGALEEFHEDGVPLVGVDVSGTFLQGIDLSGADLLRANFCAVDVRGGNFSGAHMQFVDLASANFRTATLQKADLRNANLEERPDWSES